VTAWSCGVDDRQHVGDVVADGYPLIRRKLDQRKLSTGQILLMPDVPVTGNQKGEPGLLGGPDEVAVLDGGPSQAGGRGNFIASEKPAQPEWRVLIKQDADAWHAAWH